MGTVDVKGRSSPDATVSVNGILAGRGPEGEFAIELELEEGPNLIEVIATDLAGAQKEAILLVIYLP